jgi:hypothetical protein
MMKRCEGDPTKFKPHATCKYFGNISSYTNGGETWGIDMERIWNVGMFVITWGNHYDNWQYDESMI